MILTSGTRLGPYEILSRLGAGGMGEVYLAEDTQLGRKVALKLLPAEFTTDAERVRRFEQEARAVSALNHPHIITIHEIGKAEAGRFSVMELVQGQTLRSLHKPCPLDLLVNLGGQIAKALSATHAAGITHRDIKPDNIMLRDDGYVKVLDFGLARPATPADSGAATLTQQTTPGMLLGTVAYMSPEQARGEQVTHATDIFALGIVFYELATGRHPFKSETLIGMLHAINSQAPLPPTRLNPGIPAALEGLILRMLEKEGRLRPTAAKVDQAFAELSGRGHGGQLERPATKLAVERHTVGREKERSELRAGFASALKGRGQLLCVAGEPGIGKTTLAEDFLAELAAEGQCTIARGRCSERLAGTEAYLPLLEALESLLQSGGNSINPGAVGRVLKQVAPTWYAQVVPLSGSDEESARLLNEVKAASQERLKREFAAFLQEVARLRPLVLFFDDLHWADVSTIDLLSFLAGKFDALNALIVVTYRPSDMLLVKHPFLQIKPDLQARGVCRELLLEFLHEAEIAQYLTLEFPGHRFPAEFSKLIHAKTEGSPLFMADVVRYLRDRSVIAQSSGTWMLAQTLPDIERELPESVRGMIERKTAQLSEGDRKLLTVASVQGYEFDSAVVAQVLNLDADEIEERLEKLERVFAFVKLTSETEFPNRTLTLRYRFVHVLYQNALYGGLRVTRKASLSGAVAQTLEGFHGAQAANAANELAVLWEAAREYAKAAEYFGLAAQQASQVFALQEAEILARRALALLPQLPENRERYEQELACLILLGQVLIFTRGYPDLEVGRTYTQAKALCELIGETPYQFPVYSGTFCFHFARGNLRQALEIGQEFLNLAEREQNSALIAALQSVAVTLLTMGDLTQARIYYERLLSLYRPALHQSFAWQYGQEPGLTAHANLAPTLFLLGYPAQSVVQIDEALRLGREVQHPFSQMFAFFWAAVSYQLLREPQQVLKLSDACIQLSEEHGLALFIACGKVWHGWARASLGEMAEGIAEMQAGLVETQATGEGLLTPYMQSLLAEVYGKAARPAEGLKLLAEAQTRIEQCASHAWTPELLRIKGELLLAENANTAEAEAESCHHQAIEIARQQSAKSWELLAVMSLARLWQQQGKIVEAREMLAEIYGWFTEGFDTADLKDAKALLDELSATRAVPATNRRHTVGREKERAELRAGFAAALAGRGSLLCVAGEPGIGKTTLVEDFLAELAAEGQCTIARGRCSERLAGTEAYLPLLEALESLLQSGGNSINPGAVGRVLKQVALTWYAQVVPLSGSDEESARLLNEVKAASQERLKREFAAFLQEVARLRPLVLFFDDLHWADVSTIDLLSFLAGKFDALNVLIVVTYRPSDMLLSKHPFLQIKPDLQAHGVCREFALDFLSREEIEKYLALEFPGHRFPDELPVLIHVKTEGSPLFMADLVRYLRDRKVITQEQGQWVLAESLPDIERDLPESVRAMIERKIAQPSQEDRRLLVAASVQGYEFDSAVVAQVLAADPAEVEERLEELERVYALVRLVAEREFPDHTVTVRYRFIHVLYQNALHGSLRPTRKTQLSAAVARALEGHWGEQSAGVATELAVLWEAAREFARAGDYFRLAAQNASQVLASREAVALARRGLAMVEMLPDTLERCRRELSLQVVLGNTLIATRGFGAPEVAETYSRARELCQQLGETPHLPPVLFGLYAFNVVRAKLRVALELGEELLDLTQRRQDPAIVVAHRMMGCPLACLGELNSAREHFEQIASLYDPAQHRPLTWLYGNDPGMVGRIWLAWMLWLLGYPDQALAQSAEALHLAREVSHAHGQAYALALAAQHHQFRRERQSVRELAEAVIALAGEQGLAMWLASGTTLRGWTTAEQGQMVEGIDEMRRGLDAYHSTGGALFRPYYLSLLVEAYEKAGQPREGLTVLAEAQTLVERTEERFWEAELHRLRGELLLIEDAAYEEVEQCFHQAIEIARRQSSKSLELRAAMSLTRLWQQQGKRAEARERLAEIYGWFTEGFDTADLKEARTLLEELA